MRGQACWSATGRCRGRARKTGTRFTAISSTRIRPRRCFRARGNLAFYNNLLVNDQGDGVHIQPHNDVPRRIAVFHNTVLARGNGIRVHGGLVPPEQPFRITAECGVRRTAAERRRAGESDCCAQRGRVYLTAPDAPLGRLRLDPLPGRCWRPAPVSNGSTNSAMLSATRRAPPSVCGLYRGAPRPRWNHRCGPGTRSRRRAIIDAVCCRKRLTCKLNPNQMYRLS